MANIKLFENRKVRSVWVQEEERWYFVAEDVVAILADSSDPKQYVKRMRQRDKSLAEGWVQLVPILTIDTAGGKRSTRVSSENYLTGQTTKQISGKKKR